MSKHGEWIFSTQHSLINFHQIWTWRVRTSEKTEGFPSCSSVKGSVFRAWQKIDGVWGQCPDNVDIIYHFPYLLFSKFAPLWKCIHERQGKMAECKVRAVMGSGMGGGGGITTCVSLWLFSFTGDLQGWEMRGCSPSRGRARDGVTAERYQLQQKRGVNKGNRGWFPIDTIYSSHHEGGNGLYFTHETWWLVSLVVSMEKTGSVSLLHQMCSVYCDNVQIKSPTFSGDSKSFTGSKNPNCGLCFGSWLYSWEMTLICRCQAAECCSLPLRADESHLWYTAVERQHAKLAALPEGKQPRLSSEQLVPLSVPLKREHFLPVPI